MLIRLLSRRLRAYGGLVSVVVVLQLAQAVANLYLPSLNADIIDDGVAQGDTGLIMRLGGLMLAITVVQIGASIGAVYAGARVAMSIGRDLRAGVFDHVQTFSARELGRFGAPSLITRTTNDVMQVQTVVYMTLTIMIAAPVMLVGGVIMALRESVELSWLLVVIVPMLGALLGFAVVRLRPLFQSMQKRIDAINRVLREQIGGVRVIRAFVRDDHEKVRFAGANADLMDVGLRVGRFMSFMFPTVFLIMNLSSAAVLWFGAYEIQDGLGVGSLTAFLSYLMQILISVMMAVMMFMLVPRAEVSAGRISEVLDARTSVVPPQVPVTELARRGHLELRGVGFAYPGATDPVLRDVSFVAAPGETTAIIGSTGSGKTTLLGTVPRLYDATEGAVLVDGVDVRDLALDTLWGTIGLVPQKPYLFSGTVASNVRYGKEDATDEEVWHALEVAQAADFVREMGGLDAEITQGGTNVSGGQRQRLAIARALVRRPEIYLFDDSFSALDFATDAALRAALAPETKDATVVVVAQRVSTIRHADRIVVLDDGAVVGIGTHDELMSDNETYREIVLSQVTEEEAA
ncbi:ABC transporter ATP-binding protein [Actinotalea fermentans]|uniref:Multidrug ABC transporter ATP-binding protein n=1 Tax=Actinotalea fermentans TaxID=43671 RepID=A0A511YVD1_9CELL|nr:ABC transporter ATP-binding protein [Actinotalea fermentans]KGM16579.1 multidrug ABC transporter ATPase [Actinotalea fermentans ATCC 43279 = JCM 9966 = DSM 3133]GEN79140.1 multidrug ABC transporter ATP-binding protein [Actinotalea fermentans]